MVWSFLSKLLMGSALLGVVMYENIDLPVLHMAQSFSHSILILLFIICLQVSCDTGLSSCSCEAPFLANMSALSFPLMSQWLGIHCSTTFLLEISSQVEEKLCIILQGTEFSLQLD